MAEEGSESSGSSEESDVEWEDVEPAPSILNAPEPSLEQLEALKASQDAAGTSQSISGSKPQAGSLEIVLERKAQGKNKKVKDELEKALAAFNKEIRHNQHKVHLLCLVARGLYLSRQCDDIVRQGLLLSVLGTERKELVYSDAGAYNENTILKILKWLSNKTATLHQTIRESVPQDNDGGTFSDAQLLVTLLRALGLRVRLVMVLNPIPFKESKASGKGKSGKGSEEKTVTMVSYQEKALSEEGMELTVESDAPSRKETRSLKERKSTGSNRGKSIEDSEMIVAGADEKESGEKTDLTIEPDAPSSPSKKETKSFVKRKCDKSQSKSGSGGEKVDDDGTGKNTTGTTGKKVRQSIDEGSSSSCTTAQKGTRNRSQTARQRKQRSTSTSSPYFKKQPRRRGTRTLSRDIEEEEEEDPGNLEQSMSKQSSGSDSEYVPEEAKQKKRNLSSAFEGVGDHDDDDDEDDFEQPKKKRKRSSSKSVGVTPAKKLKQAADRKVKAEVQSKSSKSSSKTATSRRKSKLTTTSGSKDSGSNQLKEGGSKSQSIPVAFKGEDSNLTAASNFDTNQSRGSSLEGVEILKSEETACWAEVYLTVAGMGGGTSREDGKVKNSRERWTCVHLPSLSVDLPHLCEKHCTIPLHYVIAIENGCTVRDVTARYASNWCTHGRKQRLSEEWWEESLRPYEPSSLEEREAEEEDILSMLYAQPLPTTISDYKNHPLYALRRHLLKFEAIYPEESQILGHCRGEPVYARQCVHTLHTRETWLKEGRVVRIGEKAYKMVKARPKRGQSALDSLQNSTVEVFGRWQTEVYMAPPVVNGKVPRNEYGNVEMFLPSMLPPGACHIKIQGISKVARKLDIDYAPAMVGWDFHSGYCHPIIDGIVVAEEYEDVLREAWQQQEQLLIEKDIQKREGRVVERWKRLTRGLLIRERVRRTYEKVNATS